MSGSSPGTANREQAIVGFLSAGFLIALPLAAVPVLIHLLNRRQKQVIKWGAMQFLLASSTRRRRLWRIDDFIVMLLRAAAVALLVLAFARPQMFLSWLGSPTGREVTVIIDNSLSTGLRSGEGVVFDQIKERAADIVSQLHDGDNVRVLLSLGSPRWLTPVSSVATTESRSQLRQMILELKPTQATANIASAVQTAMTSESSVSSLSRHVIIVTDEFAHGWQRESGAKWHAVQRTIKSSKIPSLVNVVTVPARKSSIANLSIDRIEPSRNTVSVNEPVTITADVSNFGEADGQPVVVRWNIDDESLGIASVPSLKTGQTSTLQLQHVIETPGVYRIECRLDHIDDLSLDDSRSTVVEVTNKVPILIAGPTVSDSDELQYLLAALGRPGRSSKFADVRASVFEPTLMGIEELETAELAAFRALMIINPGRITELVHRRVADYVSTGGGLWVSLGDHIEVEAFNAEFYHDRQRISPLPIRNALGNAADHEQFMLVSPPSTDYGPTRLLGDVQRLDIDQVHIYRHVPFVVAENSDARVLLETNLGQPLAIEGHIGDGRVILMGLPHDLSWSNLPLCRSYVAMVHEWLWHLTEPLAIRRHLLPGSPFRLSADEFHRLFDQTTAEAAPRALIEIPGGKKRVINLSGDERSSAFVFRDTLLPGIYSVSPAGMENIKSSVINSSPFSVARDAAESNLERLTPEDRDELASIGSLHFVDQPWTQPPGQLVGSSMQPIAGLLLFALLIILLSELVLAGWSARQRFDHPQRSPEPAVNRE